LAVKRLNINIIEDFFLWGLLSSSGGHRICWEMNRAMDTGLSRQEDIIVERRPKADDSYFSCYSYEDNVNFTRFEMIRNKCNGEIFARELRNFDYLLMLKGEIDFVEPAPITALLKKLPCIQSVMEIDSAKIKNREIFTLE
jgi:hypothetical protein